MTSQREVEREYKEMLTHYQSVTRRGINCYTCEKCKSITKTIDVDDGVTPIIIKCRTCNDAFSHSSWYVDIAPHIKPTYEWFRPTLKQVQKSRKNEGALHHYLNGGLELRKINPLQP